MPKQLLFSLTKKDFDVKFVRAQGKGGQKVNKTSSAVQITHRASGARGDCQTYRQQSQNKKEAFIRLINSDTFQKWLKIETARYFNNGKSIEQIVEEQLDIKNLIVETKSEEGKWVKCQN